MSAAARLSHLGAVTLLEAEEALGYHASGPSAAMYIEGYGNETVQALNRAGRTYLDTENGGVLAPRGIMCVAPADQRGLFETEVAGFGMGEISLAEARERFPILNPGTVAFAAENRDTPEIDTDRLLQGFAREARRNGGRIVTRARVTRLHRTAPGWTAATAAGDFAGRILVNAAGAWVDEVARLAGVRPLGFQPYRRSIARIPAPGGHDVSRWPLVHAADDGWYARPDAGKWLVSPSEEDPMAPHDAFADDMVLAEGIARYQAMVTEPVTRVETSWAGLRTFAPDRALVIGFDTEAA
ncbi:MAG: NAD(P)/FAD-dependent oxidoreductase, partial [Paracoccaceae bacterium]